MLKTSEKRSSSLSHSTKANSMPAVIEDLPTAEREGAPAPVVYTTLYDLIAAVSAEIEPSEEEFVVPIVAHLLRAGYAQFLRDVDVEMLGDDYGLTDLHAEERCVSA